MENSTLQHQIHPLRHFGFHELIVLSFYLGKNLPYLVFENLIHELKDFSENEVLIDEEKEETFDE